MLKISKKLKLDIFKEVISQENPFAEEANTGVARFLSKIWQINDLPSEDPRFETAKEDLIHHTVANSDWDYEYLFIERFKLLDSDDDFQSFVEALLSPEIRSSESDIRNYFLLINPFLAKEGFRLSIYKYDANNLPIYLVVKISPRDVRPDDIIKNEIPFVVFKEIEGYTHKAESHQAPSQLPAFVLAFNHSWNDFNLKTSYDLFYHKSEADVIYIGSTKIMSEDSQSDVSLLADQFDELDDSYCSLGQNISYYQNLKKLFENEYLSILFALKDAAFYPAISDKFENNSTFKTSLIRYDSAERLLREARFRISGYDLSNLYSFTYKFLPKFSDRPIPVRFEFSNKSKSVDRIYGLIGKNATGKTQLVTTLPIDISRNKAELFEPRPPLFSKVIAVSYSVFDSFEIPKKTASFNYIYCGLKNEDGDLISARSLEERFHDSWREIKKRGRMNAWIGILRNFIDQDLIDSFIVVEPETEVHSVSIEGFGKVRKLLSSGQNILLYVISEIVANIRYDSLILYDEPETHLHPNAITQLVNSIYELVSKFESYCILATHSPLIVGELLSRNVLVIEREGNVASIRKIAIESFGENLTNLTEEVFGNRAIPKQHKLVIQNLISEGKSYNEIVELLESDGLSLSLNALMTIKSLTNEKPDSFQ